MTLSDFADIATIVQGIFVIVSLGSIWYQLQQNLRLARAANAQHVTELSSPFNLQLIQDREMAKLWVQGAKEWDTMDNVDKYRYRSLLVWWLLLHETIYYQRTKGLLDEEAYKPWDDDLKRFIVEQDLKRHWDTLKNSFQPSFAQHLLQIIGEPAKDGAHTIDD
jgi:hypothetical protein